MKEGILFYNASLDRFDFAYDGEIEHYYGGLHCGEGFEAWIDGRWEHVSIEYDHSHECWYLPQFREQSLGGLRIRMT